jgi:hypothetical protein
VEKSDVYPYWDKHGWESRAASVIAAITGARVTPNDDGTQESMYDLTVTWPDGREAAVEVTQSTDQVLKTIWAGINQSTLLTARYTMQSWMVCLDLGSRVRLVRERVDEYLASVESEGLLRFSPNDRATSPAVKRLWSDLHVKGGFADYRRRLGTGEKFIALLPPTHPYEVLAAATFEEEVRRQGWQLDNIRKLERSGKEECHLFIWIDALHPLWRRLEYEDASPTTFPVLPEVIAKVWLAIENVDAEENRFYWKVWQGVRSSGWEYLGVILSTGRSAINS